MKAWFSLASLFAATSLFLACSDSDSADGSKRERGGSGVAGAKNLNDLTASEKRAVCDGVNQDAAATFAEYMVNACDYAGASAALSGRMQGATDLASLCEDAKSICKNQMAQAEQAPLDCTAFGSASLDTCTVTVDDFLACYDDIFAQSKSRYVNVPACKEIGNETVLAEVGTATLPDSCGKFNSKCPALTVGKAPNVPDGDAGVGCIKCSGTVTCTQIVPEGQTAPPPFTQTLSGSSSLCQATYQTGNNTWVMTLDCATHETSTPGTNSGTFTSSGPSSSAYVFKLSGAGSYRCQ